MSQNYLLSDSISRIKNAQKVKKQYVVLFFSKLILSVIRLLFHYHYIKQFYLIPVTDFINIIKIDLKYEGKFYIPIIRDCFVISKPGNRVFRSYNYINSVCRGVGLTILSTNKGVVSAQNASMMKVGGEILCKIL